MKKPIDYKNITLEDIEKQVTECFYSKKNLESKTPKRVPSVKKEGGMWKIDTGTSIMWTTDAGKKLFDETLRKEVMKQSFDLKMYATNQDYLDNTITVEIEEKWK